MPKTKIRFLVYNAYGIGGTVKTVFNFANYFNRTGKYVVEIISIKRTFNDPTLPLDKQISITVIQDARRSAKYSLEDQALLAQKSQLIHPEEDLYPMFSRYTDIRLEKRLRSIHDGVLITTMPSFNVLAARLVDSKVLCIGQEHKSYEDHVPDIQKMICENYSGLDALTVLTEKNKSICRRKLPDKRLPIYVIENGTELMKYRASLKTKVIVAAGRLADQKGYDILIRAFALIAPKHPEWIVKIYGKGELQRELISCIQEYGLERKIFLEDGTNKMMEKLSECSIHACSSNYEPFGMVIIEGFSVGLPCVSFTCDGPREIITDGYDGILVERGNEYAFAEALDRVMSDDSLRIELGKGALETAKKYDINVIGKKFENIIEKENKNVGKRRVAKIESLVLEKKDPSKEDRSQFPPQNVQMIGAAESGQVGMKTILKMGIQWMRYKVKHIRDKD